MEDLLLFDLALRGHRLLGREATETLWSGKPELGSPDYGIGFGVSRSAPIRQKMQELVVAHEVSDEPRGR